MEFSIGAYAIAFLAGALSTLSPCVLRQVWRFPLPLLAQC